ncbi:MAG: hypothetical protein DLM54_08490 [Acidimicrobiales bacterium]|nr:MAG: hypothetical protein DLM54_08490 [Acidimicrobiales bacterium]
MRTINIRELSQHTSRVIGEVMATGDEVVVTVQGRGSVMIIPAPPSGSRYATLLRSGKVRQATARLSELAHSIERSHSGESIEQVMADLRGER